MEKTVNDLVKGTLPSKFVERLESSKRHQENSEEQESPPVARPSRGKCCKFLRKIRAAFLVFTAATGIPTFYLTYYMIAKPAVENLRAGLQPASCAIVVSDLRIGRSNCSWSSCVEGCTNSLMFKCRQILVYVERTPNLSVEVFSHYNFSQNMDSELDLENPEVGRHIAKLQTNVLGCGYEPCDQWYQPYLHKGYAFQCFVSEDGSVAVPESDKTKTLIQVLLGTLPLILGVTAVLLCYILYCRKGSTDDTLSLTPDPEVLKQKQEEARLKLLMKMTEDSATSHLDLKKLMDLSKAAVSSSSASKTPSISAPSGAPRIKSRSALRRWKKAFKKLKERHFILYDPKPSNSIHPIRRNDSETSFTYAIHPLRINECRSSFNNTIHPLKFGDSISSFNDTANPFKQNESIFSFDNTMHPLRLNDSISPFDDTVHSVRLTNSFAPLNNSMHHHDDSLHFSHNLKFPVKRNDALPHASNTLTPFINDSFEHDDNPGKLWCERSPRAGPRLSSDFVYDPPASAAKYST